MTHELDDGSNSSTDSGLSEPVPPENIISQFKSSNHRLYPDIFCSDLPKPACCSKPLLSGKVSVAPRADPLIPKPNQTS